MFQHIKQTINKLQAANKGQAPVVSQLVQSLRKLAQVAISDIPAGTHPRRVLRANRKLALGDQAAGQNNVEEAIEHYRGAWATATRLPKQTR